MMRSSGRSIVMLVNVSLAVPCPGVRVGVGAGDSIVFFVCMLVGDMVLDGDRTGCGLRSFTLFLAAPGQEKMISPSMGKM